jgi:sugar lactone lactonase YvrE
MMGMQPRTARVCRNLGVAIGLVLIIGAGASTAEPDLQTPKLLVSLPDFCPTPDGMAIDQDGNLVVACPNYGDPSQGACLIKIDRGRKVTKWVTVPPMPETGRACPMGIAFGPDWDLYVCDNQNWPTGNGKEGEINQGRLLRLRIRDGKIQKMTVVAQGISHPNGVRVYKGNAYVTVSMLPKVKRDDGLLASAVYRFRLDDRNLAVANTLADKNLLATFVTRNRDCQYGADGLVFDSKGNLAGNTVFAKTDFNTPMSDKDFARKMVRAKMRTTDGICVDDKDNLYVADFSNNAVCKVDARGNITVLAQSPDGDGSDGGLDQPGEPIVWDGKLVVSCFDMVTGPDKVNTKHDKPYTIAYLELER